jgi:ribonuclease HI
MEKQHSFLAAPNSKTNQVKPVSKSPSMAKSPTLVIYIDGAARGNPGHAGAGIYITYHNDNLLSKGIYLGEKTNNQAEYLALALAVFFAEKVCTENQIHHPQLSIFSDSELLIKQMRGEYKVKNAILAQIKSLIDKLLVKFTYKFAHVRREKNKEADRLANLGVDEKHKIPAAFTKILSESGLLI